MQGSVRRRANTQRIRGAIMASVLGAFALSAGDAVAQGATTQDPALTFNDPTVTFFDRFGSSVALDGTNLLVGAPNDDTSGENIGQAHLFDAATGTLLRTFSDPTPGNNDQFGLHVALAGDKALIADPDGFNATSEAEGQVLLFDVLTGILLRTFNDPTPTPDHRDRFGDALAIDGNNVLIGEWDDWTNGVSVGQAHLFDATTGALLQTFIDPTIVSGPLRSLDHFGTAVAISGNNVLIGAPGDDTNGLNTGQAHLFDATTGALLRTFDDPTVTASDGFGQSLAIDGNNVLIGAPGDDTNGLNTGQAHLFDATTGALLQTFNDPAPTASDLFGQAVALDGNNVVVGVPGGDANGPDVGQAHLFDAATGDLLQTFNDPSPTFDVVPPAPLPPAFGDHFGAHVAIDGDNVVIGAPGDNTNGQDVGQAHLFQIGNTLDLVINWDDAIARDFEVFTDASTGQESVVTVDGVEDELLFRPGTTGQQILDLQQQVKDRVTEIFANSGIAVNILDSPTPDTLEVRFANAFQFDADGDGVFDSRLDGLAYDVGFGLVSVDRFNVRDDGQVAVFIDLNLDPATGLANVANLAETIAHEAGHGYGLRHINPDGASAAAVMDYDGAGAADPAGRFADTVNNILEPPSDSSTAGQLGTHNPVYHLRRYGLGESTASLASEAIVPGTWDDGAYDIFSFNLAELNGIGNLIGPSLFNLTALSTPGTGALSSEPAFNTLAFFDSLNLATFAGLEFLLDPEFPIRILASSELGNVWDIFFGFGDPANPDLLFDGLVEGLLDGVIYQFVNGAFNVIGDFTANIAFNSRVSPQGVSFERPPTGVPEPASILLFLFGLAGLGAMARRQPARRKACSRPTMAPGAATSTLCSAISPIRGGVDYGKESLRPDATRKNRSSIDTWISGTTKPMATETTPIMMAYSIAVAPSSSATQR